MEKRLERIEDQLDVLHVKVDDICIHTAENTVNLREHMRRTSEVEMQNDLLRDLIEIHTKEFNKKLEPLETFIDRVKFLGTIASVLFSALLLADKLGFFHFIFNI